MELTMYGFQVYSSEVDDRGIDFVARHERGDFLEIQVKSLRSFGYVFMPKRKFPLDERLYLALGLLFEAKAPQLYLIPSTVWRASSSVFVDREYEGLKSEPEWGLNVSRRNLPALEPFLFSTAVERVLASS
ncbi:MAG: hypothetical protein WCE75_07725 [Terracidiphilus sp.]